MGRRHDPLTRSTSGSPYGCLGSMSSFGSGKHTDEGQHRDVVSGTPQCLSRSGVRSEGTYSGKDRPIVKLWEGEDSNLRRRKPAILQTAPFGRSGTLPAIGASIATPPEPTVGAGSSSVQCLHAQGHLLLRH